MRKYEVLAYAICFFLILPAGESLADTQFTGYGKLPKEMLSDYKRKAFKIKLPLKRSNSQSDKFRDNSLFGKVKRNKARSDSAANSTPVYKVNIPTENGDIETYCLENESFLGKDTKLVTYDKNNKSKKIAIEMLGLSFFSCSAEMKSNEEFARLTLQKGRLIGGLLKKDKLYAINPVGKSANFNVKKIEESDSDGVKTCDSDSETLPEASALKAIGSRALDIGASKDSGHRRELEMALEADAEFTGKVGGPTKVIPYMLKAANEADGIYNSQMGVSIRVTWASYWEYPQTDPYSSLFNQKDGTTQGASADNVLAEFGQKFRPKARYDVKQFFTGKDIYRAINGNDSQRNMGVAGISPIGGICNAAYGTKPFEVNSVVVEYLPNLQANLSSHEIAHNLGSYHDKCDSDDRSIMCPTVYKSSTKFSDNSRSSVANTLSTDFSSCMDTMFVPVVDSFEPKKGAAGKAISITGNNFLGDGYKQDAIKSVFVGTRRASFTIKSANEINISLPDGLTAGENTILLENSRSKALLNSKFNVITKPSAPSGLSIRDNGDGSFELSWSPGSQAEAYKILMSKKPKSEQIEIANLPADAESFKVTGLEPSNKYYFNVISVNEAGNSDHSNQVSANTKPANAPTAAYTNTPVSYPTKISAEQSPTALPTSIPTKLNTPQIPLPTNTPVRPEPTRISAPTATNSPQATAVPTSVPANAVSIRIQGSVYDQSSGKFISGVLVTAKALETNRTSTEVDGRFVMFGVRLPQDNKLTVTFYKNGYQTVTKSYERNNPLVTGGFSSENLGINIGLRKIQ